MEMLERFIKGIKYNKKKKKKKKKKKQQQMNWIGFNIQFYHSSVTTLVVGSPFHEKILLMAK